MTFNALDKDSVLFETGPIVGFRENFFRSTKPDTVETDVAGAGQVKFSVSRSAELVSGGTDGGVASLAAGEFVRLDFEKIITRISFFTSDSNPPYDSKVVIGSGASSFDVAQRGAVLDFKNEEYRAYTFDNQMVDSEPATIPENYQSGFLEIIYDMDSGDTIINQYGRVEETVTLDYRPAQNMAPIGLAVSNGSSDTIYITNVQHFAIPEGWS